MLKLLLNTSALGCLLASFLCMADAETDQAEGLTTQQSADERVEQETEPDHKLPLMRSWFEEKGIDLPLPYGVSTNFIFMERDIEITDVRVQFGNRPPESISDRADFEVSNTTIIPAFRFDAWLLPFLNVYAMGGKGFTDTSLSTVIQIKPPLGDPIEVELNQDQKVNGAMFGLGTTMVFGGDAWFVMLDANYAKVDIKEFDEGIGAWLYSGRAGWHGVSAWGPARVWAGLMYMDSGRTLKLSEDLPVIGSTFIEVDQQPLNPTTIQFGASVTINKHWDVLLELGTNFDDAFVAVVSGAYRF